MYSLVEGVKKLLDLNCLQMIKCAQPFFYCCAKYGAAEEGQKRSVSQVATLKGPNLNDV